MFVRKKPNRSESVSVQLIDKAHGYRVVKTLDSARDPQDIERLVERARLFIARRSRQYCISKTDLRIRPMYHRRRRRIEAHVLVAFLAYTMYKELEGRLKLANVPISSQRAAELTQTMYETTFSLPNDPHPCGRCCGWTTSSSGSTTCSLDWVSRC